MLAYTIRRLFLLIPVILGILLVVTATLELVPGDPAALMLGQFATTEAVADLRHALNLDRPYLVRYIYYVWDLLHGDLGRSYTMKREIADEILKRGVSNVEDTADAASVAALILAAFESAVSGTTWTIYKTDHATTFATRTVTTDGGANPIVEVT